MVTSRVMTLVVIVLFCLGCSHQQSGAVLQVHVTSSVCVADGGCEQLSVPNALVTATDGASSWKGRTNAAGNLSLNLPVRGDVELNVQAAAWKVPAVSVHVLVGAEVVTQTVNIASLCCARSAA